MAQLEQQHELDRDVQALRAYVTARATCTTDPNAHALLTYEPVHTTLAVLRNCAGCPVRSECHDLGVLLDARVGVWGGVWFTSHGRDLETVGHVPPVEVTNYGA